jgi:Bacterial Ig domain
MSSFTPSVRRRVGGGLVLASVAALVVSSLSSVPAGAAVTGSAAGCPTLTVDNPSPGAQISAGKYVVSGAAFDPSASSGTGVSRVDFFLGLRDQGGVSLGTAIPGETTAAAPGQPANTSSRLGGFAVQLDFGSISRGDNLVAYAYASSSGAVTTVSIPVLIGVLATPTPTGQSGTPVVPSGVTTTANCTAGAAAPAPAGQPAPSQPSAPSGAAPAAPAAPVSGAVSKPVLRLDNPKPGDLLPAGDTFLQGVAFDPAASSGGVDRVDIFAGNRDTGGVFMGGGAPGTTGTPDGFSIKVTVNANQSGGNTLFAYAHSAVTGQETVLSVPVFLGVPPTPTPRS